MSAEALGEWCSAYALAFTTDKELITILDNTHSGGLPQDWQAFPKSIRKFWDYSKDRARSLTEKNTKKHQAIPRALMKSPRITLQPKYHQNDHMPD